MPTDREQDAAWLLAEHTFWEVSDITGSQVWHEEDILGDLESRISCKHKHFTVERRTMTGEAFERLEHEEEDCEEYTERMRRLNERLERIHEQQERDKLPTLPGLGYDYAD